MCLFVCIAAWGFTEKVALLNIPVNAATFVAVRYVGESGTLNFYMNGTDVSSQVTPESTFIEPNNGDPININGSWVVGNDDVSTASCSYVLDELAWYLRVRRNQEVGSSLCFPARCYRIVLLPLLPLLLLLLLLATV
jgi:hypothetical protein